jgi:hypothetical protein
MRRGRAPAADPKSRLEIGSETRVVSAIMQAALRLAFDLDQRC